MTDTQQPIGQDPWTEDEARRGDRSRTIADDVRAVLPALKWARAGALRARSEWGARFDAVPAGRPREIGDIHEHPDEWSARTHVEGVNRNPGWVAVVVRRTVRVGYGADGSTVVITGPWEEMPRG